MDFRFPERRITFDRDGLVRCQQADIRGKLGEFTVLFEVDNQIINPRDFSLTLAESEENACYHYQGVVTNWAEGSHSFTWRMHIYQEVNDGWDIYKPGQYIHEFSVDVR